MKYMQIPIPQKPKPKPEVSEWMYDEFGKKYRKVGGMIEYAPTVTIDGIEIYQDELEEFNRNRKESMERNRQEENNRIQQRHTGKICPLNRFASFQPDCKTDCALYRPTGCAMKRTEPLADTKGKPCPFMRTCQEQCALYCQGCTL